MKKIFIIGCLSLCVILGGCGNREKQVKEDIERQLESIKEGREDITDYEFYNRIHLKDSAHRIDQIESNPSQILNSLSWEIKDIQVNNSTALVSMSVTAKDIDTILSKDYVMTELVLDYASYIRQNPNAERNEMDSYMIGKVLEIISQDSDVVTTEITASVFLSEQNEWQIAYDDAFLDAVLGGIEKDYEIDLNDICEEAEKNISIQYDYNKILNLSPSNKTTRSSIKTPIQFNDEAYFDNSDYFFQRERYEAKLKVSEVIRGSKAKEMIEAADEANKRVLDVNSEYIIFKVDIKLLNNLSAVEEIEITPEDFSLLDSNGHFYNNCIVFGIDSFGKLKEGENTSGYVCFTIDRAVTPYLLFKDYMDNTLVFSE